MNGLILMACTIVALFVGYRFYARWLENTWGVDPNAKTPAQLKNDGNDYVPTSKWTVFSHQFTSITAQAPSPARLSRPCLVGSPPPFG